jgi:hypothetical protein
VSRPVPLLVCLVALDGKALRTDALAAKTGSDRRRLSKPGRLKELQDRGLVARHDRLGFYRPDAMPAALKLYLDPPG